MSETLHTVCSGIKISFPPHVYSFKCHTHACRVRVQTLDVYEWDGNIFFHINTQTDCLLSCIHTISFWVCTCRVCSCLIMLHCPLVIYNNSHSPDCKLYPHWKNSYITLNSFMILLIGIVLMQTVSTLIHIFPFQQVETQTFSKMF